MTIESEIYAEVQKLQLTEDREEIIDRLIECFRQFGAQAVVITGIPMPHGMLDPLIIRAWSLTISRDRSALGPVRSEDGLLQRCLVARKPFFWADERTDQDETSSLASVLTQAGTSRKILALPSVEPTAIQGVVLLVGSDLPEDCMDLRALHFLTGHLFRRLAELGALSNNRPGELSTRERRVLELTARGKTAADIADLLSISQRTVHAHLQNASGKLDASNKTQTVVEAIRYGQIVL
ncbi:helix-turn-helix transcriptional regulator [Coralliovum pocilloporae]|uniref:helix-turn-helix transcriptional regulator n=1 Tax=Coralliovum pocilloporae TaxID=3066369 RepID=UPI003307ABB6